MAANLVIPDPLTVLPPEIVLRILDFTPVAALGSLTAVSPAWHQFIDGTHQEAIYSSPTKTSQPHKTAHPPGGARDFSFVRDYTSFSELFDNITSWKELCKRQTLLERNWNSPQPLTRESILQVANHAVWRFKADFKRRLFISTSHAGGLYVSDMDTGRVLWQLPSALDSTEDHAVRPYAHLEYQDGMAVFDREGDAVEVWRTDQEGTTRGQFQRVAVLDHDCQTRGFQLSYWTLVVVSVEGQGFVYDMKQNPPTLTTHLEVEQDAVGHLDQNEDMVVYSMGTRGYHVYDKRYGQALGILQPSQCTERYHVKPLPPADSPSSNAALAALRYGRPSRRIFPPSNPSRNRLTPIQLGIGPLPNASSHPNDANNDEDEWGAGMLDRDSNLFVGFSRLGRVFVCSDIRKALEDGCKNLASVCQILECDSDGSSFDLGGWLSARNHRIMFEIQNRVFVVALTKDNRISVGDETSEVGPSYSFLTSSSPQLAVPVSFMALYDDAIMTTYATLGQRREEGGNGRIFPTKAIRIISLAPSGNSTTEVEDLALAELSQVMDRPSDELLRLLLLFNDEPSDDEENELGISGPVGMEDEWVDEEDMD